jgi:hypothetical protein
MSVEAATAIMTRGTEPYTSDPMCVSVKFRHDPQLSSPSAVYMSEDMFRSFLESVNFPVLYLHACKLRQFLISELSRL